MTMRSERAKAARGGKKGGGIGYSGRKRGVGKAWVVTMHGGGSPSGGTHMGWCTRRSGPPLKPAGPPGYRTGEREGQKKVLSFTNGRGRVRAVVTVARHCETAVEWTQTRDVGERVGRNQDHESGAEAHQGGCQKGSWRVVSKVTGGGLQTAA